MGKREGKVEGKKGEEGGEGRGMECMENVYSKLARKETHLTNSHKTYKTYTQEQDTGCPDLRLCTYRADIWEWEHSTLNPKHTHPHVHTDTNDRSYT